MLLSYGNLKLPPTTAIFNITSASDCPAKSFCKHVKDCCALKTERLRPNALRFRRKQTEYFDLLTGEQLAKSFLLDIRDRKHFISKFRFAESGDFRNQADVDKMTIIAGLIKKSGRLVYGYTARTDLDITELKKVANVCGNHFQASNTVKVVTAFSTG